MTNKVIKTRMVQKHDISENWAKATNFTPLLGEIIIYDDLNKFKIGDGNTPINDLPFASGGVGDSGTGDSSTILNSDENKALTAFSAASGYKTIAGKKAFKITAMPSTTSFTLDSVEGLAVDDVVSYSVLNTANAWKEVQDLAKITSITDKTIVLDTTIPTTLTQEIIAANQSSSNRIACRLWVNAKPEIGTYDLSTKANARGREVKALGEASDVGGKGNIVTAPYGAAINSGNKVNAESSFAFNDSNTIETNAIRSAVGGEKNIVKAPHSFLGGYQNESESTAPYSIGWGRKLKIQNQDEAVFGRYNEPKNNLLFSVGCGTESTGRKNAFEVYGDGTLSINGDIKRVALINTENTSGWVKFADYTFSRYRQGGALFNIKQTYVGKKYNALIELELNAADTGYHTDEGIIFRQLAGKDICDDVGYVIDSATNNISFYIKKHRYDYIYINLLSDTFDGYMKYYSNNPIETDTPTFTAKMSNSLLGVSKDYVDNKFSNIDLSDYYTKSQVDSKLSSVYKYQGTVEVPLELAYIDNIAKGDVYNCIASGDFYPYAKQTGISLTGLSLNTGKQEITLTFDATPTSVWSSTYVVNNLYITTDALSNYYIYGQVVDGTQNSVTLSYSKDYSLLQELHGYEHPNEAFYHMATENLGIGSGNTLSLNRFVGGLGHSYTGNNKPVYINTGGNVAWTGTEWDALGTSTDLSRKADKSTTLSGYGITNAYTKTEVDNKIAASGSTGDPNTIIISSATDFATTQTFANKTIKIAADIDLPANSTIAFNNCIIHGLSKDTNITTYGDNLTFTGCNIYDLTILGYGDSSTSSLNVKLALTDCKLNNCKVYGSALQSATLSNCTFVNCIYDTPATGNIYFNGNTIFIGGSISQINDNGSLVFFNNARTFINGTKINIQTAGATLFKNEMTGDTSSLSLVGCYEQNNKTINIATGITTIPVLATLNTLNFTSITQVQG